MRSFALLLAIGLTLAAAVGPDEVHIAYRLYALRSPSNFRSETQVVETPAVVRDPQERAVDDLQKQDFRILDDGQEREITSFAMERADADTAKNAPPRLIALVFDNITVKLFCNSISPRPNVLALASIADMKDAASKFVRKNVRPVDRISLVAFEGGQMTPFTSDAATLLAAIGKVALFQPCTQPHKLLTVEDVVDNMARLRGDRTIVLVSYGFPGLVTVRDEIVEKAIRGQVAIHTLDMRGAGFLNDGSMLAYLANKTGGRYLYNNNDFDLGLKELLSPPLVVYRLGFTPVGGRDGSYHTLKIQLPGHKGYSIEARPGYFAPDAKRDHPAAERPIDSAVLAEETRNDVPVTWTALPDKLLTGEPAISVVAHIDLNRLAFRLSQGRHVQKLRIVAALFDDPGGFSTGKEGELEFALKGASLVELSKQGVNATLTIAAPVTAIYRVRMVVEDQDGKLTASTGHVSIR